MVSVPSAIIQFILPCVMQLIKYLSKAEVSLPVITELHQYAFILHMVQTTTSFCSPTLCIILPVQLKQALNKAVTQTPLTLKNKKQIHATYYSIVLLIGLTCFGHYRAHHQELTTIMLITTLVVSFLACCRLEVRCG